MSLRRGLDKLLVAPVRRMVSLCHRDTTLIMSAVDRPVTVAGGTLAARRDPVPAPGTRLELAMRASGSGLSAAEAVRLCERDDSWLYQVWDGDALVHFVVVSTAPRLIEEAGCEIVPADGAWWSFCAWTAPSHRGRGIHPRVLATRVQDVLAAGGTSLWLEVVSTNTASRRAVAKAGFQEIAELRHTCTLGRHARTARLLTDGPLAQSLCALETRWLPDRQPIQFG